MHVPQDTPTRPTHRRAFLAGLGLTACAVGTAAFLRDRTPEQITGVSGPTALRKKSPSPSEPSPAGSSATSTGTRETFLPHLRSDFTLDNGDTLRLLDVSAAVKTGTDTLTFVSFSLLFSGSAGNEEAESKIRRLDHPSLGNMELFLSPVGNPADAVHYEAVISEQV